MSYGGGAYGLHYYAPDADTATQDFSLSVSGYSRTHCDFKHSLCGFYSLAFEPQAKVFYGKGAYGLHYYAPDADTATQDFSLSVCGHSTAYRNIVFKTGGYSKYGPYYEEFNLLLSGECFQNVVHASLAAEGRYSLGRLLVEFIAESRYRIGSIQYLFNAEGQNTAGYDNHNLSASGLCLSGYIPCHLSISGDCAHGYSEFNNALYGKHTIGYDPFSINFIGKYRLLNGIAFKATGLSRIAKNSDDRFELYHGINQSPDFSTPFQISQTLPFTTPPLSVGDKHYLTLRKRNAYGLSSQNIGYWVVDIDNDGVASPTQPTQPYEVAIISTENGSMKVTAAYDYLLDSDNRATEWLLYITSNGNDPDPEIDTPTVIPMIHADGVARLEYQTSNFTNGAIIKVLVRARGNVETSNTQVSVATADTSAPSSPVGQLFFGKTAKLN